MVYVNNGQVYESQPWSFNRIVKLFDGFFMFFILFFKTLFGLGTNSSKQSNSSSWGGFRGSGGGGGGGGPGSGNGGPYGPGGGGSGPRFRTMRDINQPTVYGGGCPGGSCGM